MRWLNDLIFELIINCNSKKSNDKLTECAQSIIDCKQNDIFAQQKFWIVKVFGIGAQNECATVNPNHTWFQCVRFNVMCVN